MNLLRHRRADRWTAIALLIVVAAPLAARGQVREVRRIVGQVMSAMKGTQSLTYYVNDNDGNQWMIQQGGWLQQRSGMPIYSQGAMLQINNSQPNQNNNQGRWDEKTGELLIENLRCGENNSLQITRRIFINRNESYVRYIDVFKNTAAQEQSVGVQIQSSLNYGVTSAQNVTDPRKADLVLGWIGQTGGNRCAVEVFAGKGTKLAPTVNWPQGSNVVQA